MPKVAQKRRKPAPQNRRTSAKRSASAKRRRSSAATPRADDWTFSGFLKARTDEAVLPSWKDLRASNQRVRKTAKGARFLSHLSTRRFALGVVAVAAAFVLYVGHVQATNEVFAELQQAKQERLALHLHHNQAKAAFDQATSPSVIYRRARALGLEEGPSHRPVLTPLGD